MEFKIQLEHDELHAELVRAIRVKGRIGEYYYGKI